MSQALVVYTIGHSNHSMPAFLDLLRQHGVTLVLDVRSQPYSRWAPQFNRETLDRDLEDAGLAYQFMGDALGGRPADPALYVGGRPDYAQMEKDDAYQSSIERLLALAETESLALMCGEGDYQECHRHLLISQTLLKRDVTVRHIKPDGRCVEAERIAEQLSLL